MYNAQLPYKYDEFKETVDGLRSGEVEAKYIGSGSESNVFEVTIDGNKYAVKFANKLTTLGRTRNTGQATQRKIDAGLRGLGMAGLEQIQAASIEEGVSIFKLIDGMMAKTMTDDAVEQVSRLDFQNFCNTVNQAAEVGIEFDPWNQDGSNVLYNPNTGFTLLDYFVGYARTAPEDSKVNGLLSLGPAAMKLVDIFDL